MPASLLVTVDAPATIAVDGVALGVVEPGKPLLVGVRLGEHIVVAMPRGGKGSPIELIIDVPQARQQVVKISVATGKVSPPDSGQGPAPPGPASTRTRATATKAGVFDLSRVASESQTGRALQQQIEARENRIQARVEQLERELEAQPEKARTAFRADGQEELNRMTAVAGVEATRLNDEFRARVKAIVEGVAKTVGLEIIVTSEALVDAARGDITDWVIKGVDGDSQVPFGVAPATRYAVLDLNQLPGRSQTTPQAPPTSPFFTRPLKAPRPGASDRVSAAMMPHIESSMQRTEVHLLLPSTVALAIGLRADITDDVLARFNSTTLPTPISVATRLGVVDVAWISSQSELGRAYAAKIEALEKTIQAEGTKKQADLVKMDAAINTLEEDLAKLGSVLSAAAAHKKRQDITFKMRERQAYLEDGQQELQRMKERAEGEASGYNNEFQARIKPHIEAVAKERNIDILLTSSVALTVSREFDISADVVARADADKTPVAAARPPAARPAAAPTTAPTPAPSPAPQQ